MHFRVARGFRAVSDLGLTGHSFFSIFDDVFVTHPAGGKLEPRIANEIDSRLFRDVLGHYPSGITVIGGIHDHKPVGFTCQSFYSVSISPPLISFSVSRSSKSWPVIRCTGRFSVNVLSNVQREVSDAFGSSKADRWEGIDWIETTNGNPIIKGTLIWLDCDIYSEHEAGDHAIVVGRVREVGSPEASVVRNPLVYFKGKYRDLNGEDGNQ